MFVDGWFLWSILVFLMSLPYPSPPILPLEKAQTYLMHNSRNHTLERPRLGQDYTFLCCASVKKLFKCQYSLKISFNCSCKNCLLGEKALLDLPRVEFACHCSCSILIQRLASLKGIFRFSPLAQNASRHNGVNNDILCYLTILNL
jgi:hypothetical protein